MPTANVATKNNPKRNDLDATRGQSFAPLLVAQPIGEAVGWAVWAYVALLLAGFIVFRMPGTLIAGNEMSVDRAILVVTNAGTLTGFPFNLAIDQYKWPGQAMIFALIVGGSLCTMIIGGVAVVRIVGLPYRDRDIVFGAFVIELLAIGIGAPLLMQPGRNFVASAVDAASAF